MAPRVLVSDELSEDRRPDLPRSRRRSRFPAGARQGQGQAAEIIGKYDGLAIRSATKVTEKLIAAADEPEGHRPRRHRRRQCRYPRRLAPRHHRDEHALRQLDHHRRARHRA